MNRMSLEQILAAVQAAGWEAEIFDSGVTNRTTGAPVRWVTGQAGRYLCTAQPAVNGPDYHPPIIGYGMSFAVTYLDSERRCTVHFEDIDRPPSPEQAKTIFSFVS